MKQTLVLESIVAGYKRGVPAIADVSLVVEPGTVVGLFGANGSGKSTTLRAIAGLCRLMSGQIGFGDLDVSKAAPHRRVRAGISLVPQGHALFGGLTVQENVLMGAPYLRKANEIDNRIGRVYALFPRLAERGSQLAESLSGGERAMLSIGRALMAEPSCLLLDEPSLGLSPAIRGAVFASLASQCHESGTSVLLAEQDTDGALRIVDYSYVLRNGRVIAQGGRDVISVETLQRLYMWGSTDGSEAGGDQAVGTPASTDE